MANVTQTGPSCLQQQENEVDDDLSVTQTLRDQYDIRTDPLWPPCAQVGTEV